MISTVILKLVFCNSGLFDLKHKQGKGKIP